MSVQIYRNPFGRASLMREKDKGECRWCGNRGRFKYGWEVDRVNKGDIDFEGPFCSVGCYRAIITWRKPRRNRFGGKGNELHNSY